MKEPSSRVEFQQRALALLQNERLRGAELCRSLLEEAKAVRYNNPGLMVDLAVLAVALAGDLDLGEYDARFVADCRCEALLELGNAYRVADLLDDAAITLGEAAAIWHEGTGNELLRARLCDVKASLYADRRQFPEAAEALETVYAIHIRRGDAQLAGRALISKGIYQGYGGDEEGAIRLLRDGLARIDPKKDPLLVFSGVQSQAYFLVVVGRPREARNLLWSQHFPAEILAAKTNQLKLRWVKAKIQAALGNDKGAEEELLDIKQGFEEEELYYSAALAGLELVHLWLRQGRKEEVRKGVAGLVRSFRAYRIDRETLAALMLLESALEEGVEAGALLDQVTEFTRRAATQPGIVFRKWFPQAT